MQNKQLSLFDNGENANRIASSQQPLESISGLKYQAEFLSATEQVRLLELIDSQEWLTDLKRRVQHYGYRYDYKARKINASMYVGALPDFAVQIANMLFQSQFFEELPDQLIVNEYQPGQGITPHIDCEPCFANEIATISLGSEYPMELTDTISGETRTIQLGVGSCLVLSGEARYRWKHGIKMRKTDNGVPRGRRVSMTFRKVILPDSNL